MAANAACDWPSAIRHSRSVRRSTTSHHAIAAGHREAWGRRWAYFSQPIFGPDRSLRSLHIRRGMLNMGTIGVFPRKMARPAGFEPATPGLEGRSGEKTRNNTEQSGTESWFVCRVALLPHCVQDRVRDASGHWQAVDCPVTPRTEAETTDSGAAAGHRRHPWPCAWRGGTGWRVPAAAAGSRAVGRRWA